MIPSFFFLSILLICSFYLFHYSKVNNSFIQIPEELADFHTLKMNKLNKINCKYPLTYVYISNILVFLLSRDRLYAVYYSIKYWMKLRDIYNIEIIILDHFSTYYPLLEYYKELHNKYGIKIHKLKETIWRVSVDFEIPKLIDEYLKLNAKAKYYILSDIDIVLLNIPHNVLNFYGTVLLNCNVNVVGPSLMINDISPNFPDYRKVYEFETRYMKNSHYDIYFNRKYYSFIKADIDTIFGMRRRTTVFRRHSKLSYRSLSPYIAHHIDWYLTSNNIPKSFLYYINKTKKINHSGSAFNLSNSLKQP